MAVIARRTLAKVKSSAIRPRHPEVPNLMGEVVMRRYSRTERVESRKLKVQSQEEPRVWVEHGRKAAASPPTRGGGGLSPLFFLCPPQPPALSESVLSTFYFSLSPFLVW